MNKPYRLSQTAMRDALELLSELQVSLLSSLSQNDKLLVERWINSVILINPANILRPDSIAQINDEIFGRYLVAEFLFDLTFQFYALAGDSEDFTERLAQSVKEALCIDGEDIEYSLIPPELLQSMPSMLYPKPKQLGLVDRLLILLGFKKSVDVYKLLLNNKYLVVLLLIHITNAIDTETSTPSDVSDA